MCPGTQPGKRCAPHWPSKNHNHHTFCIIKPIQTKAVQQIFGAVWPTCETPLLYFVAAHKVLRSRNEGNNLAAINPAKGLCKNVPLHICFLEEIHKNEIENQHFNERVKANYTKSVSMVFFSVPFEKRRINFKSALYILWKSNKNACNLTVSAVAGLCGFSSRLLVESHKFELQTKNACT